MEHVRITIATMKIMLSRESMTRHMTMERTSRNGARTVTRKICWNAFCRLLTSVVMRVTRPAAENLSISENEKRWMLRYIAFRRLLAKPLDAYDAKRPARMPKARLRNAIPSMMAP